MPSSKEETYLRRVAVLPFKDLTLEMVGSNVVQKGVPLSSFIKEESPDSPAGVVQQLVFERLREMAGLDLISPDRAGGIVEQVVSTSLKATLKDAVIAIGKELEADAVLVGYVYRFRERKGFDYSVEKPASVAFELQLFDCRNGSIIWKSGFDKTQTSLFEDIMQVRRFIRDKGRWVTVRELSSEGVEEVLKKFPLKP
ncbi:MAG: hypothetical protein N2317_05525 [Syntrophales bacterium]|nr:hypothetical protein [Syntrophales bacterium]